MTVLNLVVSASQIVIIILVRVDREQELGSLGLE